MTDPHLSGSSDSGIERDPAASEARRRAYASRHAGPDSDRTPLLLRLRRRASPGYQELRSRLLEWARESPWAAPVREVARRAGVTRASASPPLHAGGPPPRSVAARLRAASEARNRYAPARAAAAPGRIAALVLNRNGAAHLRRLFASVLEHSTYAGLEFVVIDHASTDDSRDVLASYQDRIPLQVVYERENHSFAYSTNRAAERTDAELLLLLNNDIVLESDVLGRMAAYLEDPSVGIVGAQLVYPVRDPALPGRLQHGGIKLHLDPELQFYRPYNLSSMHGVAQSGSGPERVPAVTGAFALLRARDYRDLGGLSEEYVYGYEDVDLCLRMERDLGLHVLCAHDVVVAHDESATQRRDRTRAVTTRRRANRDRLDARFGWALRRAHMGDLLDAQTFWTDRPLVVALAVSDPQAETGQAAAARELADALEHRCGWEARLVLSDDAGYDASDVDVLVVLADDYDLRRLHHRKPTLWTVAWIHGAIDRWPGRPAFELYDLCLCSSEQAAEAMLRLHARLARVARVAAEPRRLDVPCGDPEVTEAGAAAPFEQILRDFHRRSLRIALKVPAPSAEVAHEWGDYHFALSLRRCLWRRGHSVRIDLLPAWHGPERLGDDVTLVMRGLSAYRPDPKQINLMWNISHAEHVSEAEYASYDHVFVASRSHARRLQHLDVPVTTLLQATDPDVFFRETSQRAPREPVLFVGNSRYQRRPIVVDAIEAGLPLAVYGALWEGVIPDPYLRSRHVPNEELRHYYSNAGVVLNDHWASMRDLGFLSNRLFDAGACGAWVVSDPAADLEDVFGETVATYDTPEELHRLVTQALDDPARARERGARLAALVREHHTFEARADEILSVIARIRELRESARDPQRDI